MSTTKYARLAGVFYLLTIAAGVFAEMVARGQLIEPDDAAATARNIIAHETLYRSGLVADLVMLAAYVAVTGLLYALFKPARPVTSIVAAFFSLTGIALLAANCLTHVAPLLLLTRTKYLAAVSTAELQALGLFSLKLHSRGYDVSGVFFGTYMLLIGVIAIQSRQLPRFIGGLMAVGGIAYLLNTLARFMAPAALPDLTAIGGVAELAFALWLIVFGVKEPT